MGRFYKTNSRLLLFSSYVVHLPLTASKPLVALTTSTGMLGHIRLGHLGLHAMSDMSRSGDIPRLTVEEVEQVKNCEICCQGKITQLPHRSRSDSDEDLGHAQKMGRIHLDLVGSLAVVSANGGYQYFQ